MNMSKTLLMTSVIASLFSAATYAAFGTGDTEGKIRFQGQFVDGTCTVETNNENQNEGTVQLGTWLTNTFTEANEKTKPVPFTIGLSGCPDTLGKARVTFKGTEHKDNTDLYSVSEATGVGIGITGSAESESFYKPNMEAEGITLKGNRGEKTYYARYVTTAESVTAGAANADVTVTVQYNQ